MSQQIRFGEPYTKPLPKERLPFAQHGVVRSGIPAYRQQTFQVYVVEGVLDEVMQHVKENARVECGGILVGHPFQNLDDPDMTFVVVTASIAQDSSSHSVAHFTVGPKEIEAARDEMQKRYPGWTCVGWYHSHPGHGVFLSGQDMQIVRSIYDAEWHLALVVDPKSNEAAFFRGPKGERLPGWIELATTPETVRAIGWYNEAMEAAQNGNPRKLQHLKRQLLGIAELSHWHSLGKYQDLELELRPAHDEVERLIKIEEVPSTVEQHTDLEIEALSNQAGDHIREKYNRALECYEASSMASALGLFREIQRLSPGYKNVENYIEMIEDSEKNNNRKRLKH